MTRQSDCFFELKCEICFAISLSEMIISALSGLSCGGDGRGAGSRPGVPSRIPGVRRVSPSMRVVVRAWPTPGAVLSASKHTATGHTAPVLEGQSLVEKRR